MDIKLLEDFDNNPDNFKDKLNYFFENNKNISFDATMLLITFYRLKIHFLININDKNSKRELFKLIKEIRSKISFINLDNDCYELLWNGIIEKIDSKMNEIESLINYEILSLENLYNLYTLNRKISEEVVDITTKSSLNNYTDIYVKKISKIIEDNIIEFENKIKKKSMLEYESDDFLLSSYIDFCCYIKEIIKLLSIDIPEINLTFFDRLSSLFYLYLNQLNFDKEYNIKTINIINNTINKIIIDISDLHLNDNTLTAFLNSKENQLHDKIVLYYDNEIKQNFKCTLISINNYYFPEESIDKTINTLKSIYNPNISNDMNKKIFNRIIKGLMKFLLKTIIFYDTSLFTKVNYDKINSDIQKLKNSLSDIFTKYNSAKTFNEFINNLFFNIDCTMQYISSNSDDEEKLKMTFKNQDLYNKLYAIKQNKNSISSKFQNGKSKILRVGTVFVNSSTEIPKDIINNFKGLIK